MSSACRKLGIGRQQRATLYRTLIEHDVITPSSSSLVDPYLIIGRVCIQIDPVEEWLCLYGLAQSLHIKLCGGHEFRSSISIQIILTKDKPHAVICRLYICIFYRLSWNRGARLIRRVCHVMTAQLCTGFISWKWRGHRCQQDYYEGDRSHGVFLSPGTKRASRRPGVEEERHMRPLQR